ncbi:hypothetical protein YPPY59_1590, partial [Yersinia pestis PY-59]
MWAEAMTLSCGSG